MLLISDLHLTDKTRDEYRWSIFDFVLEHYEKNDDKNLVILGDLTDSKDHHSAILVNKIIWSLQELVEKGMEIFILKGNHDYIDPDLPFFQFLEEFRYINYIKNPHLWLIQGERCLFLPHTRNPIDEWATDKVVAEHKKQCELVFIHQSVIGSVTSNGYTMEKGLRPKYFDQFRGAVFAGDIHVPQEVGPVTYVGSPYSIRFNDSFEGRALALTQFPVAKCGTSIPSCNLLQNILPTKLQSRRTIDIFDVDDLQKANAYPDDQVKVRVHVKKSVHIGKELTQRIRDECDKLGFDLCSILLVKDPKFPMRGKAKRFLRVIPKPGEVVEIFSKKKGIDKRKKAIGRKLVEE